MLKKLSIVIVVISSVFLYSCKSGNDTEDEGQLSEMPAESTAINLAEMMPSFQLTNVQGEAIDLQKFKGKKVFVNLWATWCPPCRAEMPSIQELSSKVDKSKVEFVMLSLDKSFDEAKVFVKERNFLLPIYYPAADLPEMFNVRGIPATFIFDENGKLLHKQEGMDNYSQPKYVDMLSK